MIFVTYCMYILSTYNNYKFLKYYCETKYETTTKNIYHINRVSVNLSFQSNQIIFKIGI